MTCQTTITYGSNWISAPNHPNYYDIASGVVTAVGSCNNAGSESYQELSNGWTPYFQGNNACSVSFSYTDDCNVKYDCINGDCIINSQYGTSGMYAALSACQQDCGGATCSAGQQCYDPTNPSAVCRAGQSCQDSTIPSQLAACQSDLASSANCPACLPCAPCAPCPPCNCDEEMVSTNQITINYFNPTATPACDTSGNPIFQTQSVTVVKGTEDSQTLIFNEIANIQGQAFCSPGVAAIPDEWQIKPEYSRPQTIFQFAQINSSGNIIGPPNTQIVVPHLVNNQLTTGLPNYVKGNWLIIYVLDDNSKITIYAKDETNGMLVLNAILPLLDPKYTTSPRLARSCLVTGKRTINQITVKNRLVKYYSTGALNNVPDWISKF